MSEDPTPIALPNRLGIANVTAFKEELGRCLDHSEPIEIGAHAVERIDAAGLQLLLAFVTATEERGQPVRWSNPSEVLVQTAEMLGLAEALGLKI